MTQTNPSCPYIVTSDEGTSYCRLAEQSANSQPTPNSSPIRSSDITPPPELRQLWAQQAQRMSPRDPVEWMQHVSEKAAKWGANQELEACTAWLRDRGSSYALALYTARRPKPPSLKEQALETLKYPKDFWSESEVDTIRRAIEELPDD